MRSPHRFGIGLVTLVIAAFGAGCGCTPTPPPPINPATCQLAAQGQIQVAVVVDASTLPDGTKATSTCVNLPKGANGLDALNARAKRLGVPKPRLDQSGLLCAIDGTPKAPDCGKNGSDGYEYWGYYQGGSKWSFATTGPAAKKLANKSVEGWAFQNGSKGGDPRMSAKFATLTKG
ncbi:MAG: hypothetical protein WA969_19370 [Candidatus Microthrix parvicella]